jgi:hypothetical protein
MTPIDPHDLQVAHDLGTVEGRLDAILEHTRVIPELMKKVEKHETQLRFIRRAGFSTLAALLSLVVAWVKSHFPSGR